MNWSPLPEQSSRNMDPQTCDTDTDKDNKNKHKKKKRKDKDRARKIAEFSLSRGCAHVGSLHDPCSPPSKKRRKECVEEMPGSGRVDRSMTTLEGVQGGVDFPPRKKNKHKRKKLESSGHIENFLIFSGGETQDEVDSSTKNKNISKRREFSEVKDADNFRLPLDSTQDKLNHPLEKKNKDNTKRRESSSSGDVDRSGLLFEGVLVGSSHSPKKRKMKDKHRDKEFTLTEVSSEEISAEVVHGQISPSSNKKEKKDKQREQKCIVPVSVFCSVLPIEIPPEEHGHSHKKKKKKDKHRSKSIVSIEADRSPLNILDKQIDHSPVKKRKKNRQKRKELTFSSDIRSSTLSLQVIQDEHNISSVKKKKKHKHRDKNETVLGGNDTSGVSLEFPQNELNHSTNKKEKKKRHKEKHESDVENVDHFVLTPGNIKDDFNFPSKRKKKHKRRENELFEKMNNSGFSLEVLQDDFNHFPRLKRKKNKHDKIDSANVEDVDNFGLSFETPQDELNHPQKKTKKKHKHRRHGVGLNEVNSSGLYIHTNDEHNKSQKKKKKKKKEKHRRKEVTALGETINSNISRNITDDFDNFSKKKDNEHDSRDFPCSHDPESSVTDEPKPVDLFPKRKKKKLSNHSSQSYSTVTYEHSSDKLDNSTEVVKRKVLNTKSYVVNVEHPSSHHSQQADGSFSPAVYENSSDEFDAVTEELRKKIFHEKTTCEKIEHCSSLNNIAPELQQEIKDRLRQFTDEGDEPWPYGCYICDEDMTSKNMYRKHLAHAHNIRSYQCPLCRRSLSSPITVLGHMKSSCSNKSGEAVVTNFHCQLCPLSYKLIHNFQKHKRTAHRFAKRPDLQCDYCKRMFTSKQYKNYHEKRCAEGLMKKTRKPVLVDCIHCGKLFASLGSRNNHIFIIHKQHTFECLCGKQFFNSSTFYTHKRLCKQKQTCLSLPV